MDYYNNLVNRMVKEARELLSNKGLDYEEEVIIILKAAHVIVRTQEISGRSFF